MSCKTSYPENQLLPNPTSGGRALNAIWECENITASEKLVMLFLTSRMDFRGNYIDDYRFESVATICAKTGISDRNVRRITSQLQENGYLTKNMRTGTSCIYAVTPKIFIEFQTKLLNKKTDNPGHHGTTPMPPCQGGDATLSGGGCHHGLLTPSTENSHNLNINICDTPTSGRAAASKKQNHKNELILTWENNHPFATVFKNLTQLPICKAKFDVKSYNEWLMKMMEQNQLSVKELAQLADEWQEYHNERAKKPAVAKSSFRTWIMNYVTRRNSNAYTNPKNNNTNTFNRNKNNKRDSYRFIGDPNDPATRDNEFPPGYGPNV